MRRDSRGHVGSNLDTNSVHPDVAGYESAFGFVGGVKSLCKSPRRAALRLLRWRAVVAFALMLACSAFWSAPALWAQAAHPVLTQWAVGSGFNRPSKVAMDSDGRSLWVADAGNAKIVLIPWSAGGYLPQIIAIPGITDVVSMSKDSYGNLWVAQVGSLSGTNHGFISQYVANEDGIYRRSTLPMIGDFPNLYAVYADSQFEISNTSTADIYAAIRDETHNTDGIVWELSSPYNYAATQPPNIWNLPTYLGDFGSEPVAFSWAPGATHRGYFYALTESKSVMFKNGQSGNWHFVGYAKPSNFSAYPLSFAAYDNILYFAYSDKDAIQAFYVDKPGCIDTYISFSCPVMPSQIQGSDWAIGEGLIVPSSVTVDASGNLFVADTGNSRILEIPPSPVSASSFDLGSVSVGSSQNLVIKFQFDASGTLSESGAGPYMVMSDGDWGDPSPEFEDTNNSRGDHCISGHTYNAGDICTVNVKFSPKFSGPVSGAVVLLRNSDSKPFATAYLHGIGSAPQVSFAGSDSIAQTSIGSGLGRPLGVAVDQYGMVYVADNGNSIVKQINPSGANWNLGDPSKTLKPNGIAMDGAGNLFVTDSLTNQLVELPWAGNHRTNIPLASFSYPTGVAVDYSGNVIVADQGGGAVYELMAPTYTTKKALGSGLHNPAGVAVDGAGNVYVTEYVNGNVKEIMAADGYTTVKTLISGLNYPEGIVVDASGNLYVAEQTSGLIKEFFGPAYSTSVTVSSAFQFPNGLALQRNGNLYVADYSVSQVGILNFADPPHLSFGNIIVDSASASKSVMVQNIGNTSLDFSSIQFPAYFVSQSGTTCASNTSLTDSSPSCTVEVAFMPTVVGSITGSMALTDNTLNVTGATQSISVSGTALLVPTTTSVACSPNPVAYGDSSTCTATINNGYNVTGTVSFYNGTSCSGSAFASDVAVSGGHASFATLGTLAISKYTITACYSGDSNNTSSSSRPATLTVITGTPTITFATAPTPTYLGGNFTVSASTTNTDSPSLTYSYVSGPCAQVNGATFSSSGAGSCVVQASGAATTNFQAASAQQTVTINKAIPAITFATAPTPTYLGGNFTVSASTTNTDSATLTYRYVNGPCAQVNGGTFSSSGAGPCVIEARGETTNNFRSASARQTVTIGKATPTLALNCAAVTYDGTAHSCAGAATGLDGVTVSGTWNFNPASVTAAGSYPVTGTFTSTNSNYASGGTATGTLVIAKAASATALVSSANPVMTGTILTFTTTVTNASAGSSGTPTGTVTFKDGANFLGLGTLNANGIATFSTSALSMGLHSITAVYGGDANFTASTSPVLAQTLSPTPAALTTPTPSTTLSGASVTFAWTAGVGVTQYELLVGTTLNGSDLYNSGHTSATSSPVVTVPANGLPVYARLYSLINGVWSATNYTYTAAGTPTPSVLISPTVGSTLAGPSVVFSWTPGIAVSQYELLVGTTLNGSDLYNSGHTSANSSPVVTVPANGLPVYARLYSLINGVWSATNYTYTAAGTPTPSVLLSPSPGSTVTSTSTTFRWTAGVGVSQYDIRVGTTLNADDLYESGHTTATSSPVVTLPGGGKTIYVRLYSLTGTVWTAINYTLTGPQ